MRALRVLGLTALGFWAGMATAAAIVKRAVPSRGGDESDEVALVAIFDGIELESRSVAFRGGSMLAWFGGIEADLRGAQLTPGAHLTVHALFGGIEIRVPRGWRVESSARAFAGGVEVDVAEPGDPAAPTLVLDGFAVFGGVEVAASGGAAAAS